MNTFWNDIQQIQWDKYLIYFAILNWLFFWFIVSLFKTMTAKPGVVSKAWSDKQMEEAIEEYIKEKKSSKHGLFVNLLKKQVVKEMNVADKDFKEFLKSSGRRYCEYCKTLKPERCHHCRQCGTCILRMDHHCNWIYNCIGWTNYKYFLVFLIYADLALLFILTTYLEALIEAYLNPEIGDWSFFIRVFSFFLNASFALICSIFTGFHFIYLAGYGRTTLEFCEKKGPKDGIYDLGPNRNMRKIFGCNPIFWCFPINTMDQKDLGMFFEHKSLEEEQLVVKTHMDNGSMLTPPPQEFKDTTATTILPESNGMNVSGEVGMNNHSKTFGDEGNSLI